MSARRALAALCLVVPALALGACGGDDGGDDSANPDEQAITAVIEAIEENPANACDHMTKEQLEITSGVEACKVIFSGTNASEIEIRSITVDGRSASVDITDEDGDETVKFVKVGDEWQVILN